MSCVCDGILALTGQICKDVGNETEALICEPSAKVLSTKCQCGSVDTYQLDLNDFCPKVGGETLVPCGEVTIPATHCVCENIEGFEGQMCTSDKLIC